MDWCKNRLKVSLEDIKSERNTIISKLDELIHNQETIVAYIETLSSDDLEINSNLLNNAHRVNSDLSQKLFEMHVSLQSYANSIKGTQIIPNSPLLARKVYSPIQKIDSPTYVVEKINSPIHVQKIDSPIHMQKIDSPTHKQIIDSPIDVQNIEAKSETTEEIDETPNDKFICDQKTDSTHHSEIIEIISESSPNFEPVTEVAHSVSTKESQKFEKRVTNAIEPEKLLSRRERYLRELPKSYIPDLKFESTKYSDSSTDFFSICEGDQADFKEYEKNLSIEEAPIPKQQDLCTITFVESPDEFYIVMAAEERSLSTINEIIESYVPKMKSFTSTWEAQQKIDQYCLGYAEGWNAWYRCEVKCWQTAENLILIQFIDFGDFATVNYRCLLEMPECLYNFHKQAIKCCMELFYPPNDEEQWPYESIETFRNFTLNVDKQSQIFSIEYVNPLTDNKLGIDLIRQNETDNLTLGDLLINCGAVKQILPTDIDLDFTTTSYSSSGENLDVQNLMIDQIKNAQGLGKDESDDALEEFCSNVRNNTRFKTLGQAIEGHDASDEMRICKFTKKDGTCFKGKNCTLEHIQKRPDGLTTDYELLPRAPPQEYDWEVNRVLDVIITAASTPTKLHCQIRMPSDAQKFKCFMRTMNKTTAISTYQRFRLDPAMSELVVAKCNSKWHRAKILEVQSHEEAANVICKVLFVDFGEVADILLDDIRKIPSTFVQEPFFAYTFFISNLKRKDDVNLRDFEQYFSDNYHNRKVQAKITYVGYDMYGALFRDPEGRDIGVDIADHGFADVSPAVNYFIDPSAAILVD